MTDELIDMIRGTGVRVGLKTDSCLIWKETHGDCRGCDCEFGCGKVVRLGLLMLHGMSYRPTGWEDYRKMSARISELQDAIIAAKTPEELEKVPSI